MWQLVHWQAPLWSRGWIWGCSGHWWICPLQSTFSVIICDRKPTKSSLYTVSLSAKVVRLSPPSLWNPPYPKSAPADNTLDRVCVYMFSLFLLVCSLQTVLSIVGLRLSILPFSPVNTLIPYGGFVMLPRMIVYNFIPFISGYSVNIVIHCLFLTC